MSVFEQQGIENVLANFREVTERISKLLEMRIGAIESIPFALDAREKFQGEIDLAGLLRSDILSALDISRECSSDSINFEHLKAYSKAVGVADITALARIMLERVGNVQRDSLRYELLEPESHSQPLGDIRIAYRKAYGADIAFEKFASLIPDAAALYRENFPNVCDSVSLGDADMCILPYENTEDGKLSGFYRLIENYDLKIAASCLVRSDRRVDKTRYLLLSRSLIGLSQFSGITDFEFSLTDRNNGTLTRTLAAANLLNVEIVSIDTVRNDSGTRVFDIRITADDDKLDAFIMYLKLDYIEFSPLGLYAVID